MVHIDLFSGIGGFAYAADQIWDNVEHIFCEFDPFCKLVLAKHWPESEIYHDVRTLTTNPDFLRRVHGKPKKLSAERRQQTQRKSEPGAEPPFLLTGGFPCQSFSQAGSRRGTGDIRWLWPEMFKVIQATKPTWVIAENVDGILTWGEGVAAEQVCTDLEAEGYEVQPFVIPAAAVGAPHRRDRVWFVACNTQHYGQHGAENPKGPTERSNGYQARAYKPKQPAGPDSIRPGLEPSWERDWLEVATELCSVDDGLRNRVVRLPNGSKITASKHRQESIKAYGNAIVPAVAVSIMEGMG